MSSPARLVKRYARARLYDVAAEPERTCNPPARGSLGPLVKAPAAEGSPPKLAPPLRASPTLWRVLGRIGPVVFPTRARVAPLIAPESWEIPRFSPESAIFAR